MLKVYLAELNQIPFNLLSNHGYYPSDNLRERNRRGGQLLLEYALRTLLSPGHFTLKFEKNEYGKPFLVEHPGIHFNLSHSGNWVVCAIGDSQVGVDVEEIRDFDGLDAVVRRLFTPLEQQRLRQLDKDEILDYFFSVWTLKESYTKYLGYGLFLPFNAFSIIENNTGFEVLTERKNAPECFLHLFNNVRGYKLALCSEERVSPSIIQVVKEEEWFSCQQINNGL